MQQSVKSQRLLGEEDVENIRILYRSSLIPSLLMLLYGVGSLWFLRDTSELTLLVSWFVCILCLVTLRFISVIAFERRSVEEQASPLWWYLLLAGACVSGL